MRIARIRIEKYRSIEELEVPFADITALVGSNNAGKSTILKAVELFFDPAARVVPEDHFMHDTSEKITIMMEFSDLTPLEREEFSHALSADRLRVIREFGGPGNDNGEYAVYAKVHPAFEEFRRETNGTRRRSIYAELRKLYELATPPVRRWKKHSGYGKPDIQNSLNLASSKVFLAHGMSQPGN